MPPGHRPSGRRRAATGLVLAAVAAGMVGLSFASVPLYRLFCAATGYGGTTERATAAPGEASDAVITVRFDAQTAPGLGWRFRPLRRAVEVHPGERVEVFYRAINDDTVAVSGRATDNVAPFKAGPYFDKIQCFCFTSHRLKPGERVDMGVVFFVDPKILTDPNTRDVKTITLSYTMFRTPAAARPSAAVPAAPARSVD